MQISLFPVCSSCLGSLEDPAVWLLHLFLLRLKPPNSVSQEESCGFKTHPGAFCAKVLCSGCGSGTERSQRSPLFTTSKCSQSLD